MSHIEYESSEKTFKPTQFNMSTKSKQNKKAKNKEEVQEKKKSHPKNKTQVKEKAISQTKKVKHTIIPKQKNGVKLSKLTIKKPSTINKLQVLDKVLFLINSVG